MVPDTYTDVFSASINPYGTAITFGVRPVEPQRTPPPETLYTLRMGNEHAKILAFILTNLIRQHEKREGIVYPVAASLLNELKVAKEDWDTFWK